MPLYNKLIRDRIPDIIKRSNKSFRTKILEDDEFHASLLSKLKEEIVELQNASNDTEAIEELADILEIIHSLSQIYNSNIDKIENIRIAKKEKRGGFDKRIFLIDVED